MLAKFLFFLCQQQQHTTLACFVMAWEEAKRKERECEANIEKKCKHFSSYQSLVWSHDPNRWCVVYILKFQHRHTIPSPLSLVVVLLRASELSCYSIRKRKILAKAQWEIFFTPKVRTYTKGELANSSLINSHAYARVRNESNFRHSIITQQQQQCSQQSQASRLLTSSTTGPYDRGDSSYQIFSEDNAEDGGSSEVEDKGENVHTFNENRIKSLCVNEI